MFELKNGVKENISLFKYLKQSGRPIFIYGMGDGAVKLLSIMKNEGIVCNEIFASDSFVREKYFEGFKIRRLSDIENEYEHPIILMGFATRMPEVIKHIGNISERHELYAPDINVYGDYNEVFNEKFFENNYDKLNQSFNLLEDEKSREIFSALVNFKLSGKLKYLDEMTLLSENDIPFDNENIYSYADLGAYNGDTVIEAIKKYGDIGEIYAVEPDAKNFNRLERNITPYKTDKLKIECFRSAAWDKKETLTIEMGGGRNTRVADNSRETKLNCANKRYIELKADSLDNILAGRRVELIKYDVEGSEYKAIEGSRNTIQKYLPRLAVSLYHNNRDIYELPLLINSINERYKMKLRFSEKYIPAWEMRLYCYPSE